MSHYQVTDFLLDRANIQDLVAKMTHYTDTRQWDKLADEVFVTNDLIVDYTSMFGGEPSKTTGQGITTQWEGLMKAMDTTQHIASGLLVTLPQPGRDTPIPKTASVVGNGNAILVRNDAEGGSRTSNGGRYDIDVERVSEDPQFGNPWRIRKLKATMAWYEGNTAILQSK